MYKLDGKTVRNIQEQVQKNMSDIAAIKNLEFTINAFGITVLGRVDTEEDIPEGTYNYGDAYLVGTTTPYDMCVFTRDDGDGEFLNIGAVSMVGPQGPAGAIQIGTVTTGNAGTQASVTNVGTPSEAILNFTIPKGDKGDTGNTGNGISNIEKTNTSGNVDIYTITYTNGSTSTYQVTNGINGTNGQNGEPGQSFLIVGQITNTNQLPDPTTTPRNYAYVYDDGNPTTPDRIYYIIEDNNTLVWDYSPFAQVGSTVSVNGSPVTTFDADTKLDKYSNAGGYYTRVYAVDGSNNQTTLIAYDGWFNNTPSLVLRDSNGNFSVPDPTNEFSTLSSDAAPVKFVNKRVDTRLPKDTTTTTYNQLYTKLAGGTQDMTDVSATALANAVVQRDANSQITVPTTPTSTSHAASKKYVDDKFSYVYSNPNSTTSSYVTISDIVFLFGRCGSYAEGGGDKTYTLTFPVTLADTNYNVLVTNNCDTSDITNYQTTGIIGCYDKTTTGCKFKIHYNGSYSRGVNYLIIGKIATS